MQNSLVWDWEKINTQDLLHAMRGNDKEWDSQRFEEFNASEYNNNKKLPIIVIQRDIPRS